MISVNPIASNQTEVRQGDKIMFFSYQTLVALFDGEKWYRTNEKYSNTTSKHLNHYLSGRNTIQVNQQELERLAE